MLNYPLEKTTWIGKVPLGQNKWVKSRRAKKTPKITANKRKKSVPRRKRNKMGQESKSQENAKGIARAARKIENLKAAKERADKHRKRIANRLRAQQYARAKAAGRHGRRWRYNTRRP